MDYIREVANRFLARCPNITILVPMDFAIIAEWEKQEIPLAVVLKSINEAADSRNKKEFRICSVTDIQDAVRQDFIRWLNTSLGNN